MLNLNDNDYNKCINSELNSNYNFENPFDKIIFEFIKHRDIKYVSQNVDISPFDIVNWYNLGKQGHPDFKDFYEVINILKPKMIIPISKKYVKHNKAQKQDFKNLSLDMKLEEILNNFAKGYSIKEVSKVLKISPNYIYECYFKGKLENKPYDEFYIKINECMPIIANKIEYNYLIKNNHLVREERQKRIKEEREKSYQKIQHSRIDFQNFIIDNMDEICRIYNIPKLGKKYVVSYIIKNYSPNDVIEKLKRYEY